MRWLGFLFFLLILFLGIGFAFKNATPVRVYYYFGTRDLPVSLICLIAFGFGLIMGLIAGFIAWVKLKAENFCLASRVKNLEKKAETPLKI